MAYFIVQFKKSTPKHRRGQHNIYIKPIGKNYPNQHEAEKALCELMDKNRVNNVFVRIDRNVSPNPVCYGDLGTDGGLVRFRKRDGFHYSSAITLAEFKDRLARREERDAISSDTI